MRHLSIHIFVLLLFASWFVSNVVFGAPIKMEDLPYLCDFENDAENANWVLNPQIETIDTTNNKNKWVIGEALAYTGRKSMYVSCDGGQSSAYAATDNVLIAYRDIT
nr:hypothetical protein [Paludibacteraceae bacterium]